MFLCVEYRCVYSSYARRGYPVVPLLLTLCSFEAGFLTEPGGEGGDSVFWSELETSKLQSSCLCPAKIQHWNYKCTQGLLHRPKAPNPSLRNCKRLQNSPMLYYVDSLAFGCDEVCNFFLTARCYSVAHCQRQTQT